jgi:hypothetical protein
VSTRAAPACTRPGYFAIGPDWLRLTAMPFAGVIRRETAAEQE